MSSFLLTTTVGVAIAWTWNFRKMEGGRLKSLAFFERQNVTGDNATFLVVGTMDQRGEDGYQISCFFADYINCAQALLYNGDYPFSPGEFLFLKVRSMLTLTFDLKGSIELGDP